MKPVAKGLGLASALAVPVFGQLLAISLVSKLSKKKENPKKETLHQPTWDDNL